MQSTEKDIDIRRWQHIDRGVKVVMVTISGVKMTGNEFVNDNGETLVHWRAGLAYYVKDKKRSTSLDTAKLISTGADVQIEFISKSFHVSTAAVTNLMWGVRKDFTTLDIFNLIKEKGYHRYKYNSSGSGCQYWTRAIIKLLADNGYIKPEAVDEFNAEVIKTGKVAGCWVPMDDGEFY